MPQDRDGAPSHEAPRGLSKTALFVAATSAILAAAMLIFIVGFQFEALTSGPHIAFALFLGVAGSIGVGVGLMALVFHSNRSGHDDRVAPHDD